MAGRRKRGIEQAGPGLTNNNGEVKAKPGWLAGMGGSGRFRSRRPGGWFCFVGNGKNRAVAIAGHMQAGQPGKAPAARQGKQAVAPFVSRPCSKQGSGPDSLLWGLTFSCFEANGCTKWHHGHQSRPAVADAGVCALQTHRPAPLPFARTQRPHPQSRHQQDEQLDTLRMRTRRSASSGFSFGPGARPSGSSSARRLSRQLHIGAGPQSVDERTPPSPNGNGRHHTPSESLTGDGIQWTLGCFLNFASGHLGHSQPGRLVHATVHLHLHAMLWMWAAARPPRPSSVRSPPPAPASGPADDRRRGAATCWHFNFVCVRTTAVALIIRRITRLACMQSLKRRILLSGRSRGHPSRLRPPKREAKEAD
ncbi:hypothetical protein PCL_13025 [Purpureocillium lilacinum]|uniref:Uncharacterized protein n=1 Tax=Purpureocillium lilacinum TaxID=33203 RepID=A0A2U3E813_PURLI|nr:hypothetical protein PCL_13025 [Purpureocillium lilacinum]